MKASSEIPNINELRRICQKSKEGHKGAYYSDWSERLPRIFSIYITNILLNTSITPNQITIFNICLGVGAAGVLWPMKWWSYLIYATIYFITSVIDCCDGEVARFKGLYSNSGRYLDTSQVTLSRSTMFTAMGIFYYIHYDELWVLLAGFIASNIYLLAKTLSFTKYRVITSSTLADRMTGMPPENKSIQSLMKFVFEIVVVKPPATYLILIINAIILYFVKLDMIGFILVGFSILHIIAIAELLYEVAILKNLDL